MRQGENPNGKTQNHSILHNSFRRDLRHDFTLPFSDRREVVNIDREIAEKVMGWTQKRGTHEYMFAPGHVWPLNSEWWYESDNNVMRLVEYWQPSTDIKQAFEVAEKMRELGFRFHLWESKHSWVAMFLIIIQKPKGSYNYEKFYYDENADTPAMAICKAALAALKAIGGK